MHFINSTENFGKELLEGFALANADKVDLLENNIIVNKDLESAKRVTVVGVGALGHEPGLAGLVANGVLDAAVLGDVLAVAGAQSVVDAVQLADKGSGVLLVTMAGNGDVLSANVTLAQCAKLGLSVAHVMVQDDLSFGADRRVGGLGVVPVVTAAMRSAQQGCTLEEVAAKAQSIADGCASVTLAAAAGVHPQTGELLGVRTDGKLAIGEELVAAEGADAAAQLAVERLCDALNLLLGDAVQLYVSGCGVTTLAEQYIFYRSCYALLAAREIEVSGGAAGNLYTELDADGVSVCIVKA